MENSREVEQMQIKVKVKKTERKQETWREY